MSEQTYTCDAEIGGRVVLIEYRAPESGIEVVRAYYPSPYRSADESAEVYAACERDWADRMQAQLDAEGDAALERRRDEEMC